MLLRNRMQMLADGDADVIDVTDFLVPDDQPDRAAALDEDYERQVALG